MKLNKKTLLQEKLIAFKHNCLEFSSQSFTSYHQLYGYFLYHFNISMKEITFKEFISNLNSLLKKEKIEFNFEKENKKLNGLKIIEKSPITNNNNLITILEKTKVEDKKLSLNLAKNNEIKPISINKFLTNKNKNINNLLLDLYFEKVKPGNYKYTTEELYNLYQQIYNKNEEYLNYIPDKRNFKKIFKKEFEKFYPDIPLDLNTRVGVNRLNGIGGLTILEKK